MKKHNASNERIKRRYLTFLKEAHRQSEQTIDAVAKAIARFEADTRYRDFKAFHFEQAVAFKRRLAEQRAVRSGDRLSKATQHATLTHLKRFFQWLAREPGYKSRIQYSDAEYFNLSEKDSRVATAHREKPAPTLEQLSYVIASMPGDTEIERRNRALVAFIVLTGARDSAVASMKLKHVDPVESRVRQDAREVKTKFSKTFTTWFFPVSDEIRDIVLEWVRYLREERLWGNDDPLFPATLITVGPHRRFEVAGVDRKHWSNASSIRKIFKAAFEHAGLPYFPPHSVRRTLVQLGESVCQTPEQFKAWSQNIGHEEVLTTFNSYGTVGSQRQGEIILGLGRRAPGTSNNADEIAEAVVRRLGAGLGLA